MSTEGPDDCPTRRNHVKYMLFITADPTAPVPEKIGDINEWVDSVKEVRLDGDRLQGAAARPASAPATASRSSPTARSPRPRSRSPGTT
jgi:hypothetical protein